MNKLTHKSKGKAGKTSSLTLFLGGDVMTGRGIDQIFADSVDPVLYEPYMKTAGEYVRLAEDHSGPLPSKISYKYIWGDVLSELEKNNPDVRIINLETAITTNGEPWPRKSIHYRMHPENVKLLSEAGIDVCVLSNNHIMDWNIDGLRETLRVLDIRKIITCGAGLNSDSAATPAKVNTGNGRLLVFSYTEAGSGTPITWQAKKDMPGVNLLDELGKSGAKKVTEDVRSHRRENDKVVISVHWGRNWGYGIPKNQRKFAHYLIDKGAADVIYGHSSHHPKGIEVYKDRLILYGCGDLINDYEGISGHDEYRGELSIMYFPTLDQAGALKSLKMCPMKIHRFQLTKPPQDDINWLLNQLNRFGERFGTSVEKAGDGELMLKWGRKNMKNRLKDMF